MIPDKANSITRELISDKEALCNKKMAQFLKKKKPILNIACGCNAILMSTIPELVQTSHV